MAVPHDLPNDIRHDFDPLQVCFLLFVAVSPTVEFKHDPNKITIGPAGHNFFRDIQTVVRAVFRCAESRLGKPALNIFPEQRRRKPRSCSDAQIRRGLARYPRNGCADRAGACSGATLRSGSLPDDACHNRISPAPCPGPSLA